MTLERLKRYFIDAMAKHLPPSASNLYLLDVNGQAGQWLSLRREDLQIIAKNADALDEWGIDESAIDSAVAYDLTLETAFLEKVLYVMRPGGRLIIVLPDEHVSETYVQTLEKHGYIRILVEPAVDDLGVLIRGEKPHLTDNTLQRIQQIAIQDADLLDIESYNGRYVHLLIQQSPNKPVWKLEAGEVIRWQAVAITSDEKPILLGFSSLPKAVGFMQPAVVQGVIKDINKVGKFSKQTALDWEWSVRLNPTLDSLSGKSFTLIDIDPTTAETPDE